MKIVFQINAIRIGLVLITLHASPGFAQAESVEALTGADLLGLADGPGIQLMGGDVSGGGGDGIASDEGTGFADDYVVDNAASDSSESPSIGIIASTQLLDDLLLSERILSKKMGIELEGFVRDHIQNRVIYLLVDRLPAIPICRNPRTAYSLPAGASLAPIACTVERVTWIDRDRFKALPYAEVRQLLFHEGLRRLPARLALPAIAAVTTSLQTLIRLHNAQSRDAFAPLQSEDHATLSRLRSSLRGTTLLAPGTELLEPHLNGGGLVDPRIQIEGTGYVGLGSRITAASDASRMRLILPQGALIADSTLAFKGAEAGQVHRIGDGAKIMGSRLTIGSLKMLESSTISSSTLEVRGGLQLGREATLSSLELHAGWVGSATMPFARFSDRSEVTDSVVRIGGSVEIGSGAKVLRSQMIMHRNLDLESSASVSDSKVAIELGDFSMRASSVIEGSTLSMNYLLGASSLSLATGRALLDLSLHFRSRLGSQGGDQLPEQTVIVDFDPSDGRFCDRSFNISKEFYFFKTPWEDARVPLSFVFENQQVIDLPHESRANSAFVIDSARKMKRMCGRP